MSVINETYNTVNVTDEHNTVNVTDEYNNVSVSDTYNTVNVTDEYNNVSVSDTYNVVMVIEHGTPVYLGDQGSGPFTYFPPGDYWYTNSEIAIKGLGEYYGSDYKPIFIFENNKQEFLLDGFAEIKVNGNTDPFKIVAEDLSSIFTVTADQLVVLKNHNQTKTPRIGALFVYNGELFYGTN